MADAVAAKILKEAMEKAVVDAAAKAAREAAESAATAAAQKAARDAAVAAGRKAAQEAAAAGADAAGQKAAREAAEAASTSASAAIVAKATKEAGDRAAAKAAKEAIEEASESAATAAGEKAAREAAEAGASEAGQKAAKETAEAASRSAAKRTNYAKYLAYATAAGVSVYVYTEIQDENEAVQKCVNVCLPTNWDAYMYEDLEKSDLEYSTIAPSADQPICTAETETECDEHCLTECKKIHKTGLLDKLGPVGDLAEEVAEESTNALTDTTNSFLEALGLPPLTGPDGLLAKFGKYFKIGAAVCCCLCIVYILFMFF
jgi:hypothetical protein